MPDTHRNSTSWPDLVQHMVARLDELDRSGVRWLNVAEDPDLAALLEAATTAALTAAPVVHEGLAELADHQMAQGGNTARQVAESRDPQTRETQTLENQTRNPGRTQAAGTEDVPPQRDSPAERVEQPGRPLASPTSMAAPSSDPEPLPTVSHSVGTPTLQDPPAAGAQNPPEEAPGTASGTAPTPPHAQPPQPQTPPPPSGPPLSGPPPHPSTLATLESLRFQYRNCQECGLAPTRNRLVFGSGTNQPRLMFIGEGPGADEDDQGLPFVGRAGRMLAGLIQAMGLTREDTYITNVVKCRPPGNRNPEPDELAACRPILERQIELLAPHLIVTLGNVPLKLLKPGAAGITRERGKVFDYRGYSVLPTFHPSYLLRNPAAITTCWEDFRQALERAYPET